MGTRLRKSINLGGVRINLSKSGIGYSVGVKGARVTKKADGGVRTTLSVPGTGLSYVKDTSRKSNNNSSASYHDVPEAEALMTFVKNNRVYFDKSDLVDIIEKIADLPVEKINQLSGVKYKNPKTAVLLATFLGEFGADRFYLGQPGWGILKLITCGGFMVLWIIDIFIAKKRAKQYNIELIKSMLL